ncbi:MAG: ATP/GTP-binding protein [Archaeoglobus sp.]|uniref:ATP/GTP-binding protein n=1 Tax=Archaeoglobus sp. TaxID=1872626 RepID=UPI001DF698F0|nr:ATP/GTP-binding protein [Archaeoglobus sp.]MBO8178922.1 ATP/GTP-binding protein [Archaeoglobus sp.]
MEIFVLGCAGSGKSTFVKNFSEYLEEKGYRVDCVNLDPASEPIYRTSKDIREFVKTEHVMDEYRLGINGALIKSVEIAANYANKLKCSGEFVLYDTPGQLELFIYSLAGRKFVEELSSTFSMSIFLVDSTLITDPESLLSAVMQNAVVSLRLNLPSLTVFTKTDVSEIDVTSLLNELRMKEGVLAELMEKVVDFIEVTSIPYRLIKISNLKKTGYDNLFSAVNELFCSCGDIS